MTTLMWPSPDGSRNTVSIAGRSYSSTPGTSISVQNFDISIMEANGWTRVALSGSQSSSGNINIPYLYNFNPVNLPYLRRAVARVQSGAANGVILCLGDSTTCGLGAGSGVLSPGVTAKNWPTKLAQLLTSIGITANANSFFGDHNTTGIGGTLGDYDPRISFGAGWTVLGSGFGNALGGQPFYFNGSPVGVNFTPGVPTDTVVTHSMPYSGMGTLLVKNGATIIGTHALPTSGTAMVAYSDAAVLGSNTYTWIPNNTTNVWFAGALCYNSAVKELSIINAGICSITTAAYNTALHGYSPINHIAFLAPDCTIINMGINDWTGATSLTTFLSSYQALITAAAASGDVILVIPAPSQNTVLGQQAYVNAIYALAKTNNLPVVDLFAKWTSYEVSNPLGYYANYLHPNALGYSDEARALTYLFQNL